MLDRLANKYKQSLFEDVLPFWLKHSLDREHGGFFSCLDRDGSVFDTRKYVWMNGRQVWTLSKLYNEAGCRPEWLDAARLGAEFLRRHVFAGLGRCWFSLTREGQPAGYQRKPYGAAFVALGFQEYARAAGDDWYAETARELTAHVAEWIARPGLLGRPSFPALPPASLLADCYVMLVLGQPAPELERTWDAEHRLWLEASHSEYPEGRLFCAGSNFEITWLLLGAGYEQSTVLDTLESALEFGWDREHGGFFYFQDVENKPTLQLESSMKLWWVHAEAILALARAYEATRDPKWLRWLEKVDDYTFAHFPDPSHGEWFGYLDRYGRPTHTLKGNHYKGCFHIPRALWFSFQSITRILDKEGHKSGPPPPQQL